MKDKQEEYLVITGKNLVQLGSRVIFYLRSGWFCQGGVAWNGKEYLQAVIK